MSMNKRLLVVLGFIMFVVASQQFSLVHCRVLKPEASNTEVPQGCEDLRVAAAASASASSIGMASFPVSSNNSSIRSSLRSLTFKLASGPSKKGPGH
ncbi:hypothetical protein L6164_024615 [Bauhinia variegata]|uniref:Uncharacterized protein n=1 Tax=Bauhinia variegata TaxID=167791 RepID=A0ACB9LY31_BAUVA|nr:hypothetical protein L6164_024615 [Bauhinia variegata]